MAAPTPQISHFNRPFDALLQLYADAAAVATATTTTGSLIADLGDGLVSGEMVIDINSLAVANADNIYTMILQGSNSATFANTIVDLCRVVVGHATATGESTSTSVATFKRIIQGFTNTKLGVVYRYARFRFITAGTAPSFDPECYLSLNR